MFMEGRFISRVSIQKYNTRSVVQDDTYGIMILVSMAGANYDLHYYYK